MNRRHDVLAAGVFFAVLQLVGAVIALILAFSSGCGTPGDPFCATARCLVACVEGLGCIEIGIGGDGLEHRFEAGSKQSICGAASRHTEDKHAREAPACSRCRHLAPAPLLDDD